MRSNVRLSSLHFNIRVGAYSLLVISATLSWQSSRADDIAIAANISKVTVYQSGATVTRTQAIAIPAGSHRLVFTDLPANADPALVRVSIGSRNVRLGSIDSEKINHAEVAAARERELRAEIEKIGDAKTTVLDDIHTAEAELRLLDSVTFGQSPQAAKASVDIQSLQGAVDTIGKSGSGARTRIREANLRIRELDRALVKLTADLKKVETTRKQSLTVRAFIDAAVAVNAPVSVSYDAKDAGWQWIYEAHLDTTTKRVALMKQARVRQGSGEDWNNVSLALTGAQPTRNTQLSPLHSLFVRAEHPRARYAGMPAASPGSGTTHLEEIIVTAQKSNSFFARRESDNTSDEVLEDLGTYIEMENKATEFANEYAVPGKITLSANREPRMFPVSEDEFAVNLVARAIPKREQQAYLEAVFKYERAEPLQSGELQLFRDGEFIGKATFETFLPGTDVRLPFGADDRIRVAVRPEQEKSGKQRKLFSKENLKDERVRFEIANFHTYPIQIEVLDRIPIAKGGDVQIELPAGSTPPTKKDFESKPGVLMWALNVEPRQTATVKHYVEIRYPNDLALAGYESP